MAGSRLWRRNRRAPRPPLDVLLEDPETFRAAADAFARVEDLDESSWPYVAAVGLEKVALRWAAVTAPEPEGPWQTGSDTRLWTGDRAELGSLAGPAGLSRPVVIGEYLDSVVFLNTSRTPGPIVVEGTGDAAERLRDLIRRQLPGRCFEEAALGAWWPMRIEDGTIYLLGLALATVFTPTRARRAAELGAAEAKAREEEQERAERGTLRGTPTRAGAEQGTRTGAVRRGAAARDVADRGVEDWLRQLRASAAAENADSSDGLDGADGPEILEPDVMMSAAEPESASESAFEAVTVAALNLMTDAAPTVLPDPTPDVRPEAQSARPEPQPGDEDLEDWESGFAVSSAE